jgi:hypothetical protein
MPRFNAKLPVDWRAYRAIGETCPTDDTLRPRAEYAYGSDAPDDDSDDETSVDWRPAADILALSRALLDASESDEDEAAEYADYHALTRA